MNTLWVEQLKDGQPISKHELAQLSTLIYETDPFIYPALFSSREQAIRALPSVFQHGGDAMFSLNNCFVGRLNGDLISLILWFRGSLTWDDTVLYTELNRDIEPVATGWQQAKDEYFSSYQDNSSAIISVINVCVAEKMRGRGIGNAMLHAFILEHPKDNMELMVLASNPAALRVYTQNGFSETRRLDGFSLDAQKPVCIQMYRKAGNEEI